MTSGIEIKGKVQYTVRDKDGNIKLQGENHNIVVTNGDRYIADMLCKTPARSKITDTNGYMIIGTGWTGVNPKQNTWVNTPIGGTPYRALDTGYPQLITLESYITSNGNIVQFQAGTGGTWTGMTATGVNEVCIASTSTYSAPDGSGGGTSTLAYAQISPTLSLISSDTLTLVWSLTLLGA